MSIRSVRILPLLLALAVCAGGVQAQQRQQLKPRMQGQELIQALRGGGYVILLRHAATENVAPDDASFDIDDCSTQRGLSEEGRQQARTMGEAYRKLGIQLSEVLTSPYCRAQETADLAFGEGVGKTRELLSVWDGLPILEKEKRGAELRKLLAVKPPAGSNHMLITHTGELLYTFGLDTQPEGIAHVFKGDIVGIARYAGSLVPSDWVDVMVEAGVESPK